MDIKPPGTDSQPAAKPASTTPNTPAANEVLKSLGFRNGQTFSGRVQNSVPAPQAAASQGKPATNQTGQFLRLPSSSHLLWM